MTTETNKDPQVQANIRQNERRKGTPTFSAVRLDEDNKSFIDDVIKKHGGTRAEALVAAFKALESNL